MKKGLNKKYAYFTLVGFTVVSAAIVLIHSFILGHGFDVGMTISRYVGLAQWSAMVFLLANSIMAYAWIRYSFQLRKVYHLSKFWFFVAIMAAAMLVMLSVCPIDLYDTVKGEYGIVSVLHRFSSTSMFIMMILEASGLFIRIKHTGFRAFALIYVIYGVTMAICYITGNDWFWSHALPLESMFIFCYALLLCLIPKPRTTTQLKTSKRVE